MALVREWMLMSLLTQVCRRAVVLRADWRREMYFCQSNACESAVQEPGTPEVERDGVRLPVPVAPAWSARANATDAA